MLYRPFLLRRAVSDSRVSGSTEDPPAGAGAPPRLLQPRLRNPLPPSPRCLRDVELQKRHVHGPAPATPLNERKQPLVLRQNEVVRPFRSSCCPPGEEVVRQ